jgi:UDP-glucose 4-epimerase
LAKAHVAVYELFKKGTIELGYNIWNVGTGTGYSVLQVLSEFCKVTNIHISPVIRPARAGDISVSFASVDRIYNDLGWRSSYSLTDMVRDAWNWHQNQLGS